MKQVIRYLKHTFKHLCAFIFSLFKKTWVRILKQGTEWKTLKLEDLVLVLKTIVDSQYTKQKRAIVGLGDYRLSPDFKKFECSAQAWGTKSQTAKDNHLRKFGTARSDGGLIRSTDGQSTELPPKNWGKKQHQVKRRIAARTTPYKKK